MSWFRNLIVYRLNAPQWSAEWLAEQLAQRVFQPCGQLEEQSIGFVEPVNGGSLAYSLPGGHILAAFCIERRNLPKQAVDRVTAERARELEEQQGFKPGRKQLKELREQVVDELLPRAFTVRAIHRVWIDPAAGWLVVDAASASRADDLFRLLLKTLESVPAATLRTVRSPIAAMTYWLAADEAPAGFTIDQDTELQARGENKATVRYIRHTLDVDDICRHITAGKRCTHLAMTWADRISFVLTEGLVLKRIAPLDVLKESTDSGMLDAIERRDTDLALMTGELRRLLDELVDALGGEAA